MIWQAQRSQSAPDPSIYFECLDKQENWSENKKMGGGRTHSNAQE
jgi:hypothetical protein